MTWLELHSSAPTRGSYDTQLFLFPSKKHVDGKQGENVIDNVTGDAKREELMKIIMMKMLVFQSRSYC